jgi:hypothetical protein
VSAGPELSALLADAGFESPVTALTPLSGGWNHRVCALDLPDQRLLLKQYRPDPQGGFPRLEQEWCFSVYLQQQYPGHSPRPLACDPAQGLALFEWISGERFRPEQLTLADTDAAVAFIAAIQSDTPAARALPPAAEFCRSLSDHLHHLEARLQRLAAIEALSEVHRQAQTWIAHELLPCAREALQRIRTQLQRQPGLDRPLTAFELWLSPSDFGFHNALNTPAGPVFLDFEYAGYDDPVQLIADFCAQFEVPAPLGSAARFTLLLRALSPDPDWQLERLTLVTPIHRLKWVGIALNHFCPSGRRAFSGTLNPEQLECQLRKAQQLLQTGQNHCDSLQ